MTNLGSKINIITNPNATELAFDLTLSPIPTIQQLISSLYNFYFQKNKTSPLKTARLL